MSRSLQNVPHACEVILLYIAEEAVVTNILGTDLEFCSENQFLLSCVPINDVYSTSPLTSIRHNATLSVQRP